MRIPCLFLLITCLGVSAEEGEAVDQVSGLWLGSYRYPNQEQTVAFAAVIRMKHLQLVGKVLEPNNFGMETVEHLSADLVGDIEGDHVKFYQKYDGTGLVNHVVIYEGTIDWEAAKITGNWEIKGEWGSTFEMHRIDTYHPFEAVGVDPDPLEIPVEAGPDQ